jgi:uncharacterized protein (TIGR02246 family)
MKGLITVLAVLVVVGLGFFLYFSPTPPPEMSEAEVARMESGVTQALDERWDEYRTAMLEGDPEGILSCWTEDMRLLGPGMNLERTEFEAVVRGYFEPGTLITAFEFTPSDTFIHGDVVYQIGQMDETIQYPGGEPIEASYYILAKWEKQPDGVWRMSRGLQSPVDAPPEG